MTEPVFEIDVSTVVLIAIALQLPKSYSFIQVQTPASKIVLDYS